MEKIRKIKSALRGWEWLKNELDQGRTFSQYPTGNISGYDSMYRFDDNKEVIPSKAVVTLINKGILNWNDIVISDQVVK